MSRDKRRDPRFESLQKLWCEGQPKPSAEARNMSRSGMFIVTTEPAQVGDEMKISFEGDEGTIEVKAEVMWRGDAATGEQVGVGLRIVGFDAGADAYEKFVKSSLEAQGIDDDEPTEPK
jgi:Tfp pilus assembly protein PilZ